MTDTRGVSEPSRLRRPLWAVAATFGLISFAVSFGSPQPPDLPVRLGMLAAIVTAIGLLPGQHVRGWVVVTFSVMGFVDALASWVRMGASPGWPLMSIVFLSALQSIVAVAALLLDTGRADPAESTVAPEHSAYQRLVEAYQAYALQYRQYCETSSSQSSAGGQAEAHASPQADVAEQSFAVLQAKYARQGIGTSTQQSRAAVGGFPTGRAADVGVADRKHTVPETYPYPGRQQSAERSNSEVAEP
jgi:hypothetical protein